MKIKEIIFENNETIPLKYFIESLVGNSEFHNVFEINKKYKKITKIMTKKTFYEIDDSQQKKIH